MLQCKIMKKEFTSNILFLIAINLLIKPFYALAIDTSVQNQVGPEQYGIYLALFNFVYIQQIFADLGIQNYNNRNLSQNSDLISTLLPKIFGSKILFSLFFIAIVYATSYLFGYQSFLNEILVWIIGTQVGLSFLLYCRTNISGVGKYFVDSLFSVLDKSILIIWMSYLLWFSPSSSSVEIMDLVQAQFFSVLMTLIICLIYTHVAISRISVSIDLKFAKDLLGKVLPYALLVILMAGYSRMDGIMLEQLIDDNALEAGKYASSFRLYDTVNNFTFLFAVLLLPMFSRMLSNKEAVQDLVIWAFKLLSLGSLFLICFSVFYAEDLLLFFYDREIDNTYTLSLIYLLVAGLALSLNYIYGTLLTANGSLKTLNIIALIGFVLNLVINLVLIPTYGSVGAAIATAITQGVVLVCQFIVSNRKFNLKYSRSFVLGVFAVGAMAFIVFYLCKMVLDLPMLIALICTLTLTVLTAFLSNLVSLKDLQIINIVK